MSPIYGPLRSLILIGFFSASTLVSQTPQPRVAPVGIGGPVETYFRGITERNLDLLLVVNTGYAQAVAAAGVGPQVLRQQRLQRIRDEYKKPFDVRGRDDRRSRLANRLDAPLSNCWIILR
jgi:hypothetical protein